MNESSQCLKNNIYNTMSALNGTGVLIIMVVPWMRYPDQVQVTVLRKRATLLIIHLPFVSHSCSAPMNQPISDAHPLFEFESEVRV